MTSSVAVVILAGGEARRLPRKLERKVRGAPLLLTVYRNFCKDFPIYVSARETLPPQLDNALECPVIIDRWLGRGPLGGLATAAATIDADRLFAVAGDAPAVTGAVLDALLTAWQPGDEAVVPEHGGRLEPLAALYDRLALLREATASVAAGEYAMHALLDRLKPRRIALDDEFFVNVNTEADLARIGED
jgi:molybdopterin-guanine dinucleotide biosynthesis protein A